MTKTVQADAVKIFKTRKSADLASPLLTLTLGNGLTLLPSEDGSVADALVEIAFTQAQLESIDDVYLNKFLPWELAETPSGGERGVVLAGSAVIE